MLRLAEVAPHLLGTSHRKPAVKDQVRRVRGAAHLVRQLFRVVGAEPHQVRKLREAHDGAPETVRTDAGTFQAWKLSISAICCGVNGSTA